MIKRPMLAATIENLEDIVYPVLASPKLDGIRAIVIDGKVYSRSLKPIPNQYVQRVFGKPEYNGLDGELIVGDPVSRTCFRDTTSGVMTIEGEPRVCFWAFDHVGVKHGFSTRLIEVARYINFPGIIPVPHSMIQDEFRLLELEENYLTMGYEGVMLRAVAGPYKQGRATLREGWLSKLKRFKDSEAVVVGVQELMHNDNDLEIDELGYAKRSSHQENMRPSGKMGTLLVNDKGVEFGIGTGFTDQDRIYLWKCPPIGKVVKYRYFPTGSKDKPRFPVFVGFRDQKDM